MIKDLIKRLYRYTWACIATKLDPDFANAVRESAKTLEDCCNELCFKCGKYREDYMGACDGCRWRH